jgi:hypothetical protein
MRPQHPVSGTHIWPAFAGTHHCVVPEIAFAGTPIEIVNGVTPTPEGSGLLAQCNLQVTTSDNRGPASAHGVPQTVAVKPSAQPPLRVATRIRLQIVLINCPVSRRCGRLGSNDCNWLRVRIRWK